VSSTDPAPGLLVVSHGQLAEELRQAVLKIIDADHAVAAVSIDWDDNPEQATARIRDAVKTVDIGGGVVILTDMFGGTPTNLALTFYEPDRVEIVTGVNLPMLVKFTNLRGVQSPRALAERLAERGREAIHVASGMLDRRPAAVKDSE